MNIGEICNRTVVVVTSKTVLSEAAYLMREHHVGSLVIVEEGKSGRMPVGIVTETGTRALPGRLTLNCTVAGWL